MNLQQIINRRPLLFIGMFFGAILSGCAATDAPASADGKASHPHFVQLPLIASWHEGRLVYYITTDVSDQAMAKRMKANFVPALKHSLPANPLKPGQYSAVERIYKFTNFAQHNVLPSAPTPVGHASTDTAYSPLWRLFMVTWVSGSTPRELRSEEEVLSAQDKGWVMLAMTDLVVNCPVIYSAHGGLLPGAKLIGEIK